MANESTPLVINIPSAASLSIEDEEEEAELLTSRLLAVDDDDSVAEDEIIRESLRRISTISAGGAAGVGGSPAFDFRSPSSRARRSSVKPSSGLWITRISIGIGVAVFAIVAIVWVAYQSGAGVFGPRSQPVGPYQLVELQEGSDLFNHYTFYDGPDSAGSDGYNDYVGARKAQQLGIINVTFETDKLSGIYDDYLNRAQQHSRRTQTQFDAEQRSKRRLDGADATSSEEPFVYISSSHTDAGPRHSVRLEGKQRYHRGLFIIDVRHMPAGCGVWPAFWLTDEENWPVHGEIDIVEGVNYQSEAKTALHSTKGCTMAGYVPAGVQTGNWDTAIGIPDRDTGIPDMTVREANNCFVYDPHQWLNQGCVAVDSRNDTLGQPLNAQGGGVFALEWDPINRHIRTWAFTPHTSIPGNLLSVLRDPNGDVVPDPNQWPLPYGYFAVGDQTGCPAAHFQNMRLVINTAFCGSVSGNRFHIDCPVLAKKFDTCNDYVKSRPDEIENDSYWKIRGVYVYQRSWQKAWVGK